MESWKNNWPCRLTIYYLQLQSPSFKQIPAFISPRNYTLEIWKTAKTCEERKRKCSPTAPHTFLHLSNRWKPLPTLPTTPQAWRQGSAPTSFTLSHNVEASRNCRSHSTHASPSSASLSFGCPCISLLLSSLDRGLGSASELGAEGFFVEFSDGFLLGSVFLTGLSLQFSESDSEEESESESDLQSELEDASSAEPQRSRHQGQ